MLGEIRKNYKFSIKLQASQNSYSFILLHIDHQLSESALVAIFNNHLHCPFTLYVPVEIRANSSKIML